MIKFSFFFFFKQKTAYEMRISDWSSDVCSSDLVGAEKVGAAGPGRIGDGHMFCAELDGDGIEIKLEIAADAHGAFQAAAEHPFEGMLEEAALGDEEDQPEREEDADDPEIGRATCRERGGRDV